MREATNAALARSALTLALLGATIAELGHSQAPPDYELKWGGYAAWPWVEPDPNHAGEFIYWTLLDGPVLRRHETHTGQSSDVALNYTFPWSPETAHHVAIEPLTGDVGPNDAVGLGLGSGGLVLWALGNMTQPLVWKTLNLSAQVGDSDLWESFVLDRGDGLYYTWIAGDDETLLISLNSVGSFFDASFVLPGTPQADPPPPGTNFKCLGFFDPEATPGQLIGAAGAEVVGGDSDDARIYYTRNGVRWSKATFNDPIDPNLIIWDIEFFPPEAPCNSVAEGVLCGVAVGGVTEGAGPGFFFTTTDGGQTWDSTSECILAGGMCPNTGLEQLPAGTCTNSSPPSNGTNNADDARTLYGVTTLPDGSAMAVGYVAQIWRMPPQSAASLSSAVWEGVSNYGILAKGPFWGIHGGEVGQVVVTGQWGTIWEVSPDGSSYGQVGDNETLRLHDVERAPLANAAGVKRVWAVGLQSMIFASDDDGASWSSQYDYTSGDNFSVRLRDVEAYGADTAVAVGQRQKNAQGEFFPSLLTTVSGGESCSWVDRIAEISAISQLEDADFWDAAFHPFSGEAWAVARKGNSTYVVQSDASLNNWALVGGALSGFRAEAIEVSGAGDAIAVGFTGSPPVAAAWIWSANSWSPIPLPSPTPPPLRDVEIRASLIWAVGDDGTVLRYAGSAFVDAGVTLPQVVDLVSVEIADVGTTRHFLLGSGGGTLFHRGDTLGNPPGTWVDVRTNTTTNVEGLSLSPDGLSFMVGVNPRWGDASILSAQF